MIWLIYLYRITLGPALLVLTGSACRFEPTCSHYGEEALRKYGILKGGLMTVKRVLRCNPWHEGGYDPVE